MKPPSLKIDGKLYTAKKPKTKLLKKMVELQESEMDMYTTESIDQMLEFFLICFNHQDLTKDILEEGLDLDEFFPKFVEISQWLQDTFEKKMRGIPKGQSPQNP